MSKGMCQKVAVAQALLPRSGLLVLDEAWTGLDAEAKAALDEVVAERLADGGSVVFVDHEPARLARLGAERWQVGAGRVEVNGQAGLRVTDGRAGRPAGLRVCCGRRRERASLAGAGGRGSGPIVIVVSGCRPGYPLDGLRVLSVNARQGGSWFGSSRVASDAVLRARCPPGTRYASKCRARPQVGEDTWSAERPRRAGSAMIALAGIRSPCCCARTGGFRRRAVRARRGSASAARLCRTVPG